MNRGKHILLSAGLLLGVMFTGPMMNNITTITAMAAEQQSNLPYSRFWETQPDGSWKYKYDNGTYATGWILDGEVYHGVTISADTSESYRGALSEQTLTQLGLDVTKAIDITGTQHVSGGEVVTPEQPQQNPTTQSNGGTGEGGSTTSSTDDMDQTGKITDPNDLQPGQFAIIDGHMWARDPSSGTLYDMGSASGEYYSGYVPGIS